MDLYSSSPDLAIPKPILLQHFYLGLSKKSAQFLDIASGGTFLHLCISEGRAILDTIHENSPYTDGHHDSPEEKDNPIPTQEDVSTSKSLPNPSNSLAASHIPESFLRTSKEEEIHPLEFPFEFEEDLSPDVGNPFNHPIQQRSLEPWPLNIFSIHLKIWLPRSPSDQNHLTPQTSMIPHLSPLVSLITQTKEALQTFQLTSNGSENHWRQGSQS